MATTTAAPGSRFVTRPLPLLPDENLWIKYSAHGEAPLSFVGSLALHAFIAVFLVVWGIVAFLFFKTQAQPLPIDTIHMPSGGGGTPKGSGTGSGPVDPDLIEVTTPGPIDPLAPVPEPVKRPPLEVKEANAVLTEFNNDQAAERFIQDGNENMKMLARLDKEVREKLRAGVNPSPGKGGTGKDGGKGTGEGKGNGSGKGDGRMLNKREERMLRWSMSFNTRNGQDYLAQLRDLGAVVAIPSTPDNKSYKLCDLNKTPYQFVDGELSQVQKIYWVDDKPASVHSLTGALGYPGFPSHFVAFMPVALEELLIQKELAYRGLPDDRIFETKFKCVLGANGKYEAIVIGQKPK